jgi:hypothetical protein
MDYMEYNLEACRHEIVEAVLQTFVTDLGTVEPGSDIQPSI